MADDFEPSPERGRALDQGMRERLAESLDYIAQAVGDDLGLSAEDAARTSAQLRSGPQSPHLFGCYYDLVLALENEDLDRARGYAAELTSATLQAPFRVASISDRPQREVERYRRLFLPDPALAGEPPADLLADCERRIAAAFDLLERGFPEMAGEVRALLREIVIAAGPEDPRALTFDGSSSYMLWGAILLNARGQTTVLDTAQALAHESGHNLLFGFCASGSLTDNADEEVFSSPLRADPRPMDGVIHATYVIARMHQTLSRLLASGILDEAQQAAAQKDLAAHERNFEAGDSVIREGGKLTDIGHRVMGDARAYMAAIHH